MRYNRGERKIVMADEKRLPSVGLVLEGGGLRGLFTAGVLDVFLKEGIRFPAVVGVSAGAAFGCNFKSRQAGRPLRYNARYCRDPRFFSLRSLWKTGDLFGADFCYRALPLELDPFDFDTYEADPTEFWAVCTNMATGKAEFFLCSDPDKTRLMEIFRASASMPLVSRPVVLDRKEYLDGGIADSVPLLFMEGKGFEKNVVVLTRPRAYRKKKSAALPLVSAKYKKYPALQAAMARRHEVYNETLALLEEREREGRVLILAPEADLPAGRTERDPEKLRLCHALGETAALAALPRLRAFLEK